MWDGHIGVQAGNHVGGQNLDDEGLFVFLQYCADQDAAIPVYPWDMMAWTVAMARSAEVDERGNHCETT